jgi:anaerobic magnesium-protoporphyrin IX monomethyl ester cyclase
VRVLLINPSYPFEEFPRLLVTLPYVASALRADGHEVEILDLLLSRTTPSRIEARMQRFRPELVGVTSVTLNHHIAEDIARWVRACDGAVPIVMGGPHVSFEIEGSFASLGPALDYIAVGEGEHTMVELARALRGRMDLRDVRGLAAFDRSTGKVGKNAPRPLEDDLDTIPDPARDLVPLSRYLAFDSHASVVTSRGCPYECIFCSAPAWTGRKVRYRTPSLCVDEIERLSAHGFTEITIEDDLFTLYRKHFLAVCGELMRRHTGIRWNAFSRVDTITPEIVKTMADAGCQAICFGVESGDQAVLDLVKKRSDLDKVKEAMRMTQDVGISALASFIIGLPGETVETLKKTVEFANDLHQEFGSLYGFHILAPFPGTEVRDRAAEYGLEILNSDWKEYDANHVVSRTPGADPAAIQAVADEYEETIERYVRYQDHLYATGQLGGYELKMYHRRRRQTLLWKLLLDEVVEALPPLPGNGVAELKRRVATATDSDAAFVGAELERVLELGALVPDATPEGTRWRWAES